MGPQETKVFLSAYQKNSKKVVMTVTCYSAGQKLKKNLKADYKKVKDYNGETGKNRKTCKFFEKLDVILGHRPASAPSVLLDAGSSSTAVDEPTSQDGAEKKTENGDGMQ